MFEALKDIAKIASQNLLGRKKEKKGRKGKNNCQNRCIAMVLP